MVLSPIKSIPFWMIAPNQSRIWIIIPLIYTLFLQILTGIPKPDSIQDFSTSELLLRLSEEIFDYPYWLQDLSHFPLFFLCAWFWCWFFMRKKNSVKISIYAAVLISLLYATLNELAQVFIPQRFPSMGDLAMNLFGTTTALMIHRQFLKNFSKKQTSKA